MASPFVTKSQVYSTSGAFSFSVPANVTQVEVTMIGAGGCGGGNNNSSASRAGGGSGEYCQRVPMTVTGGGTLTGTVGAKGTISANSGQDGGATTCGVLTCAGGKGGLQAQVSAFGGGPGGGGSVGGVGQLGSVEHRNFVGGASGGTGVGLNQDGFKGGDSINGHVGGAGGIHAGGSSGGGGGGASPWGDGGAGGTGAAGAGGDGVAAASTAYGAGGGGAGGNRFGGGGNGADGYVLIEYVDAP